MMLSAIPTMSLISLMLEPTEANDAGIFLRPRLVYDEIRDCHYTAGDNKYQPHPWTESEVMASALWWRQVALGLEPINECHKWLGGGIAFGRVSPWNSEDFAIDVIILGHPDAPRPAINYRHGAVELDVTGLPADAACELTHITIDATSEQVAGAAQWWESLVQWNHVVAEQKVPHADLADILRAGMTPDAVETYSGSGTPVGDVARFLLGLAAPSD